MDKLLTKNRKASFEYEILDKFEAGIVLFGYEAKSLKNGGGNLQGAYVSIHGNSAFIENFHIAKYQKATLEIYEPKRTRKLLLNKREIDKISGEMNTKGVTVIPLACIAKKAFIKIEIALARGKKKYDKRESIKKRDQEMRIRRSVKP